MRRIGVLLGMVLITLVTVRLAVRVYSRPLDVSGRWQLPEAIQAVIERDEVAYPAHVLLATVLEATRAAPAAVGLQWVKAAAHARNAAQMQRATTGLVEAQQRTSSPAEFWAT